MPQVAAIVAALTLGLLANGAVVEAKTPCCKKKVDAAGMKAKLQAVGDALKPLASSIDLKHWTPKHVVATAGRTPEALHRWVHANTTYAPYEGALRGPEGVLWDRLGNNLDRALLLQALLKAAGHKARLVRGSARTVPKLPPRAPRALVSGDALKQRLTTRFDNQGRMPSDLAAVVARTERFAQASRLAEGLWKQVKPHLKASKPLREGQHWWVEVAQGSDWRVLDPAHASPGTVAPGAGGGKVVDRLPAKFEHRIQVSVVAEQVDGSKRSTHRLVTASVHSRDAVGETISVRFRPIKKGFPDLLKATSGDRDTTIAAWARDQTEWVPVVTIGKKVHKKKSFDIYGRPNSKPGKPHAMSAATSALDMLGRKPAAAKKPTGVLEAVWIAMRFDVPGRPPTTERRVIYRRDPTAAPKLEALRRGLAAATKADYAVLPATPPPERAAYVPLRLFSRHGSRLLKAVDAIYSGDSKRIGTSLGFIPKTPIRAMVWSLARVVMSPLRPQVYIAAPNVAGQVRQFDLAAGGKKLLMRELLDVVANPVAFLGGADARGLGVIQGVVDTEAENILRPPGPAVRNASARFRSDAGKGWRVLTNPSEVASAGVPAQLRPEMERALKARDVVVIEGRRKASAADFSWWRVTRQRGVALGMTGHFGTSATEYAITVIGTLGPLIDVFKCVGASVKFPQGPTIERSQCLSCILYTSYAAAVGATLQLTLTMAAEGPAPTPGAERENQCPEDWGNDRFCAGMEPALRFYRKYAERTLPMRVADEVCGINDL